MSDVAAFVKTRLAEEETGALESARAEGTDQHDGAHWDTSMDEAVYVRDSNAPVAVGPWEGSISLATARHIARHDPARVLAQVAAMRAIVDLHPEMLGFCQGCASERFPCRTLQRIAAFWPSHPDYDPAWSPDS